MWFSTKSMRKSHHFSRGMSGSGKRILCFRFSRLVEGFIFLPACISDRESITDSDGKDNSKHFSENACSAPMKKSGKVLKESFPVWFKHLILSPKRTKIGLNK